MLRTRWLWRSALVLLTAFALLGPSLPSQAVTLPQHSSRWRACAKTLDGVRTSISSGQRTVTIVNQTSRTYARLSFWIRTDSACSLVRKFLTSSAQLGYNGTVDGATRRQGSGTTPLGTYTMTEAFGNASAPGMWLPYHRVRSGDYWVEDAESRYYNTLRNKSQGGFRWSLPSSSPNSSERLQSYPVQYRYAVVINFNRAPDRRVKGRGSGIFLHVKGSGATAGCVAITAAQLRTVLAYLHSGDKITISR